ncbi:MAG: DNA primase [Nitrospirota bacterium]
MASSAPDRHATAQPGDPPGAPRPAGGFGDAALRAIRERVELVEFIGAYVSLKRTGQNAIGLCPFHADKRPSFTVSPSKQLYHCFGCGAGGDLFAFVMQRESLSFPEAVQWLARKANVPLPTRAAGGADRRRQTLYDIHAAAAEHFRRRLAGREGDIARRYLQSRRLSAESVQAFGLGYAASSWDDLLAVLTSKGWTAEQVQDAGLAVPRQQGGGRYDRFRHRVMCPIRDTHGQVVAFGGRVLDDAQPKYLNSPETPLFSKGRHLFALDVARQSVAANGALVVVEGYFDVIAAHQAGFTNVVATLGTALTPAHLDAIRRLVSRVCLVFDPDAAGVRAALRTVDLFSPIDLRVDVVSLPDGKDPDRVIHEDGPEAFRAALDRAAPLTQFVLEHLAPVGDYRDPGAKKAAVARALPVIAGLTNAIDRDHYLRWLADQVGVAEASLREELHRVRTPAGPMSTPPPSVRRSGAHAPVRAWPHAEKIVAAAVVHGRLAPALLADVSGDTMTDRTLRAVVDLVQREVRSGDGDATVLARDRALADGRHDVADALAKLATHEFDGDDPDQEIYDCVVTLRIEQCRRRVEELSRAIQRSEAQGRHEEAQQLQGEQDRLAKESVDLVPLRGSRMGPSQTAGR